MPSKPTIRLYDSAGAGIIICWESGVMVSNQTGGFCCLQPEVEGVFVPLGNDDEPLWYVDGPEGPVYGKDPNGDVIRGMNGERDFLRKREQERERRGGKMSLEADLMRLFSGPKHGGSGATQGLDDQDADAIEVLLRRADGWLGEVIRVDRSRLRESHEAWVHVSILGDEAERASLFAGFGPYPRGGVLTWANGD